MVGQKCKCVEILVNLYIFIDINKVLVSQTTQESRSVLANHFTVFSSALFLSLEKDFVEETEPFGHRNKTANNGSQAQSFCLSISKVTCFCSSSNGQLQISQGLHGLHPEFKHQVSCFLSPSHFLFNAHFVFAYKAWIFACFF